MPNLTMMKNNLVTKINLMPEKYLQLKAKLVEEHKKTGKVEESFINEATKQVGGVVNPQQTIGESLYDFYSCTDLALS